MNSGHPTSWRRVRETMKEKSEKKREENQSIAGVQNPGGGAHRLRVEERTGSRVRARRPKDAKDQGDSSVSLGWVLSHLGGSSFTADENGLR